MIKVDKTKDPVESTGWTSNFSSLCDPIFQVVINALSYSSPPKDTERKWAVENSPSLKTKAYNLVANILGITPILSDLETQNLHTQESFDLLIDYVKESKETGKHVKHVSVGPMTYADLQELTSLCPNIESLDLSDYGKALDSDLKAIATLKSLKSLNLSNCKNISFTGIGHLEKSPVEKLYLQNMAQLESQTLTILNLLGKLKTLTLSKKEPEEVAIKKKTFDLSDLKGPSIIYV